MALAEREAPPIAPGVSGDPVAPTDPFAGVAPTASKKRRSTSHLKLVPPELAVRERVKTESARFAETLAKSRPFTRDELERWGRDLLTQMDLPEGYLGFTMVLVGNYYWKQQFLKVPFHRRMLLLPHCLKHAEGCPAEYDEFGLNCEKCGACKIADYKVRAEQLGYKVLVAEGSPVVLKLIVSGYIDGILGVACLNVLEKAIDKVLIAGVPSFAVPLHSGDCKNTKMDESWVWEVLEEYAPESATRTSSFVPLLRAANEVFDAEYSTLVPATRAVADGKTTSAFAPRVETERVAHDFLRYGGKRFRPFLTLATYDALKRAQAASKGQSDDGETAPLSEAVKRVAIAIEAFHKASLVHDDIEDEDPFRYGQVALHVRHGTGMAINVGDYLVGLGYRLVTRERGAIGADAVADILDRLADAHVKLSEGQGAELAWRRAADKGLRPIDAMTIYALKTSPAFEAALLAGCRLAGPVDELAEPLAVFARHLGVGFQILNDLKDWRGDGANKVVTGQDAFHLRPTLLLALALESAKGRQRDDLLGLLADQAPDTNRVVVLRRIFDDGQVFAKAEKLVEKSRERAEAVADDIQPDELRQLLYFVVDQVLTPESDLPDVAAPASLPIVAAPVAVVDGR